MGDEKAGAALRLRRQNPEEWAGEGGREGSQLAWLNDHSALTMFPCERPRLAWSVKARQLVQNIYGRLKPARCFFCRSK